MIIQELDIKMSIIGDTTNHDQFIHSAEFCALLPTRLEYIHGQRNETQSFRNNNSLLWVDSYTYFPLHLLAYHGKVSHNLLNYARAHNGLWLQTEFSSINNLMIPLSLGGKPQDDHTGTLGYPRTTMDYSRCPDNHRVLQGASTNPPRCVLKQPP